MPTKRKRMLGDVNKFSIAQMLSNSDGKTSASGTMGVFICLVGGVSFFIGAMALIFKGTDSDILVQSISLVYAGALLLGYRKSSNSRESEIDYDVPEMPLSPEIPIERDILDGPVKKEAENDLQNTENVTQLNS